MRKHKLLCNVLTMALLLSAIPAAPFAASVASAQTAPISSQEEIDPEDPAAYCQGNASEIEQLEKEETQSSSVLLGRVSSNKKADSTADDFTSVSPFTGATYTHSGVFSGMNIYHGVDVSYHQGTIDWTKVKAAGIDFAIIRMGYRGYSSGTLATDNMFTANMQEAIAAGLKVGAYFFTEAITVDEAIAEAQYVANALAPYQITMPVAIDWESNAAASDGGRKITAGLTKAQNTIICSAFCDVIRSYGYTPMVYANKSDLTNRIDGAALGEKYEIWLARYNKVAEYSNPYSIWQYSAGSATNKGTVNGISGNVDLNFWYTSGTIDNPVFTHTSTAPAVTAKPTAAPDSVDDVKNLTSVSAAKKITLSWDAVDNATGYQIYRKDTYNGSYKKVKTITDPNTTTWINTGLSKKHEYYYKVRAYITTEEKTIYSDYALLTAATMPSAQVGIAKKTLTLTKTPAKNGKRLITVAKGTSLAVAGQTHLKNGKKFLHVKYITTTKTYDGYLPTNASLKYYQQGVTTTNLNLRKTAGINGKLLANIPKNTPIAIIGKKKVAGTIWYKTSYSGKKGKIYNGYVSSSYVKK